MLKGYTALHRHRTQATDDLPRQFIIWKWSNLLCQSGTKRYALSVPLPERNTYWRTCARGCTMLVLHYMCVRDVFLRGEGRIHNQLGPWNLALPAGIIHIHFYYVCTYYIYTYAVRCIYACVYTISPVRNRYVWSGESRAQSRIS